MLGNLFRDDVDAQARPIRDRNTADAAIMAAIDGVGIARVLSYQALDAVASGRLVTLLDRLSPPLLPVHLVYQANRRASVNVRAFIDAARAHFAGLHLDDFAADVRGQSAALNVCL